MTDKNDFLKRFMLIEEPVKRVWEAWTESGHLTQWLCDVAEIDPRVGGAYHFGGPSVARGGGGQKVTIWEPGEALGFQWELGSNKTEVEVRFQAQAGWTRIDLTHRHIGQIGVWLMDDVWKYYLNLLKFYLEMGQVPPRIDFSQVPSKNHIDLTLQTQSSAEAVFDAVTIAAQVAEWVEANADIDLRLGGKYETDWWQGATITELDPGHKVTFKQGDSPNEVSWIVEKTGQTAKLRVVHSGFGLTGLDVENLFYGWSAFLVVIAMYLQKKRPAVSWSKKLD